jgi:nucleoside-diphosphate kinase
MIKPNSYLQIGKILAMIERTPLRISNVKMFRFTREQAAHFYQEHAGKPFFEKLIAFMTSDYVVGLELVGVGAIQAWRDLIGPTNSEVAREKAPGSVRALFGKDGTENSVHGSDSAASAARELAFIFSKAVENRPFLSNCSLCLIKPHILTEKMAGAVVDEVLSAGFEVSCMQMVWPDKQVNI